MQKQKVLFVTPSFQSFVKNDIQILSGEYSVIINHYNWNKKLLAPIYMLLQLFEILKNIPKIKLIIVSFGGYWAFFPSLLGKLFAKPTFIILHGTDCASIPEIGYGSLRKPLLKEICKISYRLATGLFPVSESLVYNENTYFKDNETLFQGFKHFFPKQKTKFTIIPNGLDHEYWKPNPLINKEENSFMTVFSGSQFLLKGGDLILETARNFPECTFYFAGLDKPLQVRENLKNVHFLGKLDPGYLKNYYNKSQFYFQLSIFEGFGCALCEAMLCECIPIVSNVNQLPEIIGDSGFILMKRNPALLEETVKSALCNDNKNILQKKSRAQITSFFTLKMRKQKLLSLIKA